MLNAKPVLALDCDTGHNRGVTKLNGRIDVEKLEDPNV